MNASTLGNGIVYVRYSCVCNFMCICQMSDAASGEKWENEKVIFVLETVTCLELIRTVT